MRATQTDRALTLAVADDEVIAWDLAGRLYSVWRGGRTSRRGLSGQVLQKWRESGETQRAWLDNAAADALVAHAASRAVETLHITRAEAGDAILSAPGDTDTAAAGRATLSSGSSNTHAVVAGRANLSGSPRERLTAALERAAAFDANVARADARRFAAIYSDVGILPPDQYLAVVVQATEGCSFRTCEFCDLFGRPFRVRTADEFASHVRAVREFMGDSLLLHGRAVFLGAANALALPVSRLLAVFDTIRGIFPSLPVNGFVDAHSGAVKTAADWRQLARAGLRRVYVGLESGHDPLLELVRKPSRAADAVVAVGAMKDAGISVAVIVMLGLGGEEFSRGHVEDTIGTLNHMPLGAGDLIYFSDLVVPPGARYAALAARAGVTALDRAARQEQRRQIGGGLRFAGTVPQMATYDIREFVY